MPFALLLVGALLLVSSVRNRQDDLFTLVKGDFTGQGNFIYWVVSILIIGSIGYIPKLKALSVGFLTLVIIVLVLSKGNPRNVGGGFFQQFTKQIGSTGATGATAPGTGIQLPQIPSLIVGPGSPIIKN